MECGESRGSRIESSEITEIDIESVDRDSGILGIENESDHGVCEIIEESINSSCKNKDPDWYIAVGQNDYALVRWVLKNLVTQGDSVMLVHIFSQVKFISTPLGKLPITSASPDVRRKQMATQEFKRTNLIQYYMVLCSKQQVKSDNIMIESDTVEKTLIDLISVLNIKKIVVGTESLSRKGKLRSGCIASYVRQNKAPDCEVLVVDKFGKFLTSVSTNPDSDDKFSAATTPTVSPSPSLKPTPTRSRTPNPTPFENAENKKHRRRISCSCINFKDTKWEVFK